MENEIIDPSSLAKAMLEWESVRRRLDEIENVIKCSVLQAGKTQTVGNVRATYSSGRKSYDYKAAIDAVVDSNTIRLDALEAFTSSVIDYRAACSALGIDTIPFTQSGPSVSVKLME